MSFYNDGLRRFVELLSVSVDSSQVCQGALEAVADELRLGRVTVSICVPRNRYIPEGQEESLVLYQYPGPCAPAAGCEQELHTGDGGTALFRAEPRANASPWTE